jgi:hypothetical protein
LPPCRHARTCQKRCVTALGGLHESRWFGTEASRIVGTLVQEYIMPSCTPTVPAPILNQPARAHQASHPPPLTACHWAVRLQRSPLISPELDFASRGGKVTGSLRISSRSSWHAQWVAWTTKHRIFLR